MDANDDKQQPRITDFSAEGPVTSKTSSDALSKDATESAEKSKGKKSTPQEVTLTPLTGAKMDQGVQPAVAESKAGTGSIFALPDSARQAPAPEVATPTRAGETTRLADAGNWNNSSFLNPAKELADLDQKMQSATPDEKYAKLYKAQSYLDLITPENFKLIIADQQRLRVLAEKELDSAKREKLLQRIDEGTKILESRWQTPLRLAFAVLELKAPSGEVSNDALRLLKEAIAANPKIKDDPELVSAIDTIAPLYGNMAPAVKQAMQQAIVDGAQIAQQQPQERSPFQDDPTLAQKIEKQAHLAQLDSPDPYVHAREAEVLMQQKGVLSKDARDEHARAIELAKKVEFEKGKSFNSLLAEIGETKKSLTSKQEALAKLKEQIAIASKESKNMTMEMVALNAERTKEAEKAHSKDMSVAICSMFSQTVKQWNGEAAKEEKKVSDKMAAVVKKGNELQKLQQQRKVLEGEIKASEDSLKMKQTKLAEIGKPISDKHVSYAKALLQDADARLESAQKAEAEKNKDEFNKNEALRFNDKIAASLQLNRAEKIAPELANDEKLKALKEQFSIVSTSIGEKIKDITPEQQQELDDTFLRLVNRYNHRQSEDGRQAIAAGAKPTDFQKGLLNELNALKGAFPELEADEKLNAAMRLIGRGEQITDEALSETAKLEAKALKISTSKVTSKEAFAQFAALLEKKQFKDAEEAAKAYRENVKPFIEAKKEAVQKLDTQFKSCVDFNQLAAIRATKEALENDIAEDEAKILGSIGALYLTPEKFGVKQKDGTVIEAQGPGEKPEQALAALKQVKEDFPGIEKNPAYEALRNNAQELQKGVKEMEIKAAEDAEKGKEAAIDLTTTLASWGGAAAAGAAATAGLVAAGVIVAGAPITVPAALAIVGITTVAGALVGGTTKWGLANALDAKDKDLGSNFSKGALIGGTTGIGGGGLKVGGLVLANGAKITQAGATIYKGVKIADVANRAKMTVPLTEKFTRATAAATKLEAAAGNAAHEAQIGQQILLQHLADGKITQSAYNLGSKALSDPKIVAGGTADVLEWAAGIKMTEQASKLTAAGLKFKEAAGATGTKAIDAGYDILKATLPQATKQTYAKWNVLGHAWNLGKDGVNAAGNMGKMAAYATPYVATRAAIAGTALGAGTGTYNAIKYGSKVANGEINENTQEKWSAADAFNSTWQNTLVDTGIGLGTMGTLKVLSGNPQLALDLKTGGAASMATGAAWVANKLTGGAVNNAGAKLTSGGGLGAMKSFYTGTLAHDNMGFVAPFMRNALPLAGGSGKLLMAAKSEESKDNRKLASNQGELFNYEIAQEEAGSEAPAGQAAPQEIANAPETTQSQGEAPAQTQEQAAPQPVTDNAPGNTESAPTETVAEGNGPPQPITDG